MYDGKTEEALKTAREVFAADPTDPAMIMLRAEAAFLTGNATKLKKSV